ncbi:SapB/AmfS family lanthipeptide [Actinomadura fibrosa]|uniref:SapB/AmfS family lanthipeptide n=1 Tax=Actinomadura fibrosa TaxID=111802 RepID=A0ABW2XF68_9ACTN|nr:SapB/AmfS family lanthipeptide [Actinomadura fibrosa]
MALLDLQGMVNENGGGDVNSSLSLLCHSSHSITICL